MNSLITYLLGGTEGAASSEARFGLVGMLVGAALIYTGHVPQGTNLLMASVIGYSGARALPKASAAVADMVASRSAGAASAPAADTPEQAAKRAAMERVHKAAAELQTAAREARLLDAGPVAP